MRLLVSERGVRLTLPRGISLGEAGAFLLAQRGWLARQLDRAPAPQSEWLTIGETKTIPLRGARLPLLWQDGRYARCDLDDEAITIQLPARSGIVGARRLLRDFYLAKAREDVGRWLPHYLPGLPLPPSALRLRPLASLWGSLSPTNALSLDLSLVLGPPAAFEYVLVHELCHLLQRNHSPAFWREVEQRSPRWREQRDYLHSEGLALKSTLRALIAEPR